MITSAGEMYVLGYNYYGQLGLGDQVYRGIPTLIPNFINIVQVSCGPYFTAFITLDGELYTFGNNTHKQLGNFHNQPIYPHKVDRMSGQKIIQISCGGSHMVALTDKGEVYSWGDNMCGQLGLGDKITRFLPSKINMAKEIKQVSCGSLLRLC